MKREREDGSGKKWGGGKKADCLKKVDTDRMIKGGGGGEGRRGGGKKDQIQKRGHNMVMAARVTEIESGE